jgi:transcriptional regulator with XRE-family HTH domain
MSTTTELMHRQLAEAVVNGQVELLGIDEIVKRLGVSRSTLERWVRNSRASFAGQSQLADFAVSISQGKTNFPAPDIYIGASPKWTKDKVISWLMSNSTK